MCEVVLILGFLFLISKNSFGFTAGPIIKVKTRGKGALHKKRNVSKIITANATYDEKCLICWYKDCITILCESNVLV